MLNERGVFFLALLKLALPCKNKTAELAESRLLRTPGARVLVPLGHVSPVPGKRDN